MSQVLVNFKMPGYLNFNYLPILVSFFDSANSQRVTTSNVFKKHLLMAALRQGSQT